MLLTQKVYCATVSHINRVLVKPLLSRYHRSNTPHNKDFATERHLNGGFTRKVFQPEGWRSVFTSLKTLRMKKGFAALVVGVSLLPSLCFASGLTHPQVQSILSLLLAFNVDATIVSNVDFILEGQNVATTTPQTTPIVGVPSPIAPIAPVQPVQVAPPLQIPVPPPFVSIPPTVTGQNYYALVNDSSKDNIQVGTLNVSSLNSIDTSQIYLELDSPLPATIPMIVDLAGGQVRVPSNGSTAIIASNNVGFSNVVIDNGDNPIPDGTYTIKVTGIGYADNAGFHQVTGLSIPYTFTVQPEPQAEQTQDCIVRQETQIKNSIPGTITASQLMAMAIARC